MWLTLCLISSCCWMGRMLEESWGRSPLDGWPSDGIFKINVRSLRVCVLVTQLCPTLRDPMDYNLSGSSAHGIPQNTGVGYCCCPVTQSCLLLVTPWTAAHQASLSLTISWNLPKIMSIVLVMPSSYFILWCPLLFLSSIFPSIRDFSNELPVQITWPKYWSFSFSISPSNEYSGLISFKIDWFDLLTVKGLQESSPAPKFNSINSLVFCLLSQLDVTTGEDHSFDYMYLCWQSDAFQYTV